MSGDEQLAILREIRDLLREQNASSDKHWEESRRQWEENRRESADTRQQWKEQAELAAKQSQEQADIANQQWAEQARAWAEQSELIERRDKEAKRYTAAWYALLFALVSIIILLAVR